MSVCKAAIATMQAQAEQAQIRHRDDGTPIYRFCVDKWADARTLKAMLAALVGQMETYQNEVRRAQGREMDGLRVNGRELQVRLMNYQTGLAKLESEKKL